MRTEVRVACGNQHGEGVLWSAEDALLLWTDIHGGRIWLYDPQTDESHSHPVPGRVGCFAPRKGRPVTQLVAAFTDGFGFLDLEKGTRDDIAPFEPDQPHTRLNDGRTDRQGRFVAGGMNEDGLKPTSSVWSLSADGTLMRLVSNVGCANSTCFSPDGRTMYFADSAGTEIWAYDYDPQTGSLGQRRTFAILAPNAGVPDGSCVDADGYLWNAVWEGYRVERYAPDGRLDRVIEIPVRKPTCCAFGGRDLDTLFITTSRLGETKEDLAREPLAGHLFAIQPGVRGLADEPFAG
jgi:L-arabinonolactonase